jgi:two-component system, NtrC family, nitrogen regulation response regulator NtrX
MNSVLYLGCPDPERAEAEKQLSEVDLAVLWGDTASFALTELHQRNLPVLLDLSRGAAVFQIASEIRSQRASTLMFAVVDSRRADLMTEAVLAGMADVFTRPIGGRRVANAIARELKYQAHEHVPATPEAGADLYAHSAAMGEVMTVISRALGTRAGVLIRGEDGSGRQVAARALHVQGKSRDGAFVSVDCAAYDAGELEVDLFGPSPRAQNGSNGVERVSVHGRLHQARGGTLYLQNVAEAPTRVQLRLAQLLRDREATLSETGELTPFDVQPIAGVGPGFDIAVHEGRVREELLRRLSAIRIEMPALRNRREDIPALANYFVREICATLRVPPKTLSRSALSLIAALPWRGNAVELRRLLESIVTDLPGGRGIALEDVLTHVRLDGGHAPAVIGTLKQARSRFEREYIATVLEQHRGRISDAARALGIQRTNLYRKIRSLKVSRRPGP